MQRAAPGLALALGGWLFAAAALADSPLARLADSAADEIARIAKGGVVELQATEDRTGRGLAPDFHALVLARLKGRVPLASSGPRLRIASVVSGTPGRLSFSARVVEEPAGTLVDLLAVSVPAGGGDLTFLPQRPPAPNDARLEISGSLRTPVLATSILDLAFLDADRLLVLSPDEVSLYRWTGDGLSLLARRPLPGPLTPVRTPGGLLVTSAKPDSFWALTSRAARAAFISVEGSRLVERQQADTVPWPAAPQGLRYLPGTNLIEGAPAPFGTGPVLDLDSAAAISAERRLLCVGCRDQRVGLGLADLWPGFLAVSSPAPPGAQDSLIVLEHTEAGLHTRLRVPVDGGVRALAGRVDQRAARLVAAITVPAEGDYLLVLDLVRP